MPSEEFGKSDDILKVYDKERHIMSIITEEDLLLETTDFVSWRRNFEICRYTSAEVTGTHWSPSDDEMLYIILNEDWAVGERYYHWCDACKGAEDIEGFGGNMHWNICDDCIKRTDLVDVLDFEHHERFKDASSTIDGPCDAPPFSEDWNIGRYHFMALVDNRMYELNGEQEQDAWEARVHGSWTEQADAFLTQQYKRYGDHIPSGEYTCDVCGIVLNDRRRSQ